MERFKKLQKVKSDNGRIFDFNGKVHVGDKGTIFVEEGVYGKKHMMGSIRKPRKTHNGYLQIQLMDINGNKGFHYIHRLVAYAWLKKKEYQTDVLHKDDNPLNNSVDNLCWGTHTDNMQDMLKKGRKVHRGTTHPAELVMEIYTRRRKGESVSSIHSDYPHIAKSTFMHFTSGRALRQRGLL